MTRVVSPQRIRGEGTGKPIMLSVDTLASILAVPYSMWFTTVITGTSAWGPSDSRFDPMTAGRLWSCELTSKMQINNNQGSGCSLRSRSQSSWVRTPSRGRGGKVPQWCGCGLHPVLRWLGTELNPDRPFYGCPNYNLSRNYIFFSLFCVMIID
ncbi:hypothetical protein PIB30_017629 [Stylosanthes scabra]|uniref:Uncharacterized protein n=1 Tax=Stylosanthes scabra TaxID=79078 RepID=A0ABU6WAR7_9FABA|nr:hypothetical protein [Stylosanthes scabra]